MIAAQQSHTVREMNERSENRHSGGHARASVEMLSMRGIFQDVKQMLNKNVMMTTCADMLTS